MPTKKKGGCLCGDVRYEVDGDPQVSLSCHCTFCQSFTGSAYSSVAYFEVSQVEFRGNSGEYEHRSDESGRKLTMLFCSRCASTLAVVIEARPGWIGIQIGTLDDPTSLRIARHVWTRSKRPESVIPVDVDEYEFGSADGAQPTRFAGQR